METEKTRGQCGKQALIGKHDGFKSTKHQGDMFCTLNKFIYSFFYPVPYVLCTFYTSNGP